MLHTRNDPKPPPLPKGLAPELTWQRVAIAPAGRRTPDTPLTPGPGLVPLLDHAGPAATWLASRPVGAAEARCPASDRVARALTADEWDALRRDLVAAARRHPRVGLAVCEDNLLFSGLSPVACPGPSLDARLARLRPLVRAVAAASELTVFLTVDEGCPGGLDLSAGRAVARAVADEGASALVALSGTARLPALMGRARASADPAARFLSTARYLDVDLPVFAHAYAHPALDVARAVDAATAANLAGLVVSASPSGTSAAP